MGGWSYEELLNYKGEVPDAGYKGPTIYKVGEKMYRVPPWNHPSAVANKVLAWVVHTIFYGIYIVAPMGHGKTTLAQCLLHYLHTNAANGIPIRDEIRKIDFNVVWAGLHEFTHQEQFYNSLPKKTPHIIVFDDISGALKQLREQDMERQFSTLTQVRHIIDPEQGRTPVITIVVGHYSKNLEKEFRAMLGMSIYASFGNEERTNLDSIAEKGSEAYRTLKYFGDVYSEQYENHKFCLYLGNGTPIWFDTDAPFRCAASLRKTGGQIFLFTNQDTCDKCVKKFRRRLVSAKFVFDKVKGSYDKAGISALQNSLARKGFLQALSPNAQQAFHFINNELDPVYDYDPDDMIKVIWQHHKRTKPKRTYIKHKLNDEIKGELDQNSKIVERPVTSPLANMEANEPEPIEPVIEEAMEGFRDEA